MDELQQQVRSANKADLWDKLAAASTRVSSLLRDPQPGLWTWVSFYHKAQREVSEVTMELGLPYIGLGHYQKTNVEDDQ